MKRIVIPIMVLALVLSIMIAPIAFATVTLPNYEKEKAYAMATCDNGATSLAQYGTETYKLFVITTKSGHTFYELNTRTGAQLLYKTAGSSEVMELSHEAWDAKLKEHATNLYNLIHRINPSDCTLTE